MAALIDLTTPYGICERGFHRKNIFADEARLLGSDSKVVVDVGAHHGDEIATYLEMFPRATVHAFEPTPASLDVLRAAYADTPRVRIYPAALAESPGTGTLHAYSRSVRNALTPYQPEETLGREPDAPIERVPVPVWTLDAFCADHAIDQIDLLKTDTQGAEARVLAGARRMLGERRVRLIALEVLFVPLFELQGELEDLVSLLRADGYRVYDWYNFAYNDAGQVLFGDAIFLPGYPSQPAVPVGAPPDTASSAAAPMVGVGSEVDDARAHDVARVARLKERIRRLERRAAALQVKVEQRDLKVRALKERLKNAAGPREPGQVP